jgi:uncharacterized protein YutE (UPF0331/DUF86 family)
VDERIKEHLKHLNKYYLLLADIRKKDYKDFEKDAILQGSSEQFLQLAIESCLNIGNRLISLYQFQKPVSTPETYADIFREMQRLGVIEDEFSKRLVNMAKFRNRLVHLYWELDLEAMYQFLQSNLNDFNRFQKCVVDFMNVNKLEPSE